MFYNSYKYYLISILLVLIFSTSKISFSSILIETNDEKKVLFAKVIDKLTLAGVDSDFINRTISHPNTTFNEKFVKINVNNFASKTDYSHNWKKTSVDKTANFISQYRSILELAELEYNVPKEIIASILFIETRHGEFLGNNNILSVYYSTALCDQDIFIEMNKESLKNSFNGSTAELNELLNKIEQRSERKSKWAIEQLIALAEIEKKSTISIYDLKGSWAGAFGISQFLPSSYLSWAIDGNGDGIINLFEKSDAIFSVANYLNKNGWNVDPESKRKAVFHYNNSSAYVEAVFKLAELSLKQFDSLSTVSDE